MSLTVTSNSGNTNNKNQNQLSFQGMEMLVGPAANQFYSLVQTNEIFGATVVDFVSMIAPRTAVDATRGPAAAVETARRESMGAVTNCLIPGFVAMGVGYLMGKFINPELKIDTSLPIDSDTAKMLHESWKKAEGHKFYEAGVDKKQIVQKYAENILNQTTGLVGENWIPLESKTDEVKSFAGQVADLIINEKNISKKEIKTSLEELKKQTVDVLGASESIKIGGEKGVSTTVERLYNSMHSMGTEIFTKAKDSNESEKFVEKFLKISPKKSAVGLALVAAFGLTQQAVNRYLTKKETGSSAFVGLSADARNENDPEKQDKNSKFKLILGKIASVATLASIAAASIAGSIEPKKIMETFKPQNLIKKLEFNGKWPTLNQLKMVYFAMVAGRMIAATDKHELRETDTRDIPGYINWLILGGFVSKLAYNKATNNQLLKGAKAPENVSWFKKAMHIIKNNSLVSHAEIEARKDIDAAAKTQLKRGLNIKILAGLTYSTLALGVFVPLINKYITNRLTSKKQGEKPVDTYYNNSSLLAANSLDPMNKSTFTDFIKTQQRFRQV